MGPSWKVGFVNDWPLCCLGGGAVMSLRFLRLSVLSLGLILLSVGCSDDSSAAGCSAPLVDCGGACVDTNNDPDHCGACGTACTAEQLCSMGACGVTCLGGTELCDGLCVNTDNDPDYCGTCGTSCSGDEVCSGGECSLECVGGTSKCGAACVDLDNDPANCGFCGTVCGGSGGHCSSGTCVVPL